MPGHRRSTPGAWTQAPVFSLFRFYEAITALKYYFILVCSPQINRYYS